MKKNPYTLTDENIFVFEPEWMAAKNSIYLQGNVYAVDSNNGILIVADENKLIPSNGVVSIGGIISKYLATSP